MIDHASDSVTAWTTGEHISKGVSLQQAVADVDRYTDKPITIDTPALASLRIYSVFPTRRPEAFARAIVQVNELEFSLDADGAIRVS